MQSELTSSLYYQHEMKAPQLKRHRAKPNHRNSLGKMTRLTIIGSSIMEEALTWTVTYGKPLSGYKQ